MKVKKTIIIEVLEYIELSTRFRKSEEEALTEIFPKSFESQILDEVSNLTSDIAAALVATKPSTGEKELSLDDIQQEADAKKELITAYRRYISLGRKLQDYFAAYSKIIDENVEEKRYIVDFVSK